METKMIAMVVVGIIVGAGIGMGIGYFVWNDGGDGNETYWFYLDYGGEADHENVWISASAGNVIDGLKKALDNNDISYVISETGWITSIDGLDNGDWTADGGYNWMNWFWSSESIDLSFAAWAPSSGLNVTMGTIFFIGYVFVDGTTYKSLLDPNYTTNWKGAGPFAST